jgi:hypothetical protein
MRAENELYVQETLEILQYQKHLRNHHFSLPNTTLKT